ncbi:uncharacterized protein LOC143182665 isoform X2 [Calliopsis andreniformis]
MLILLSSVFVQLAVFITHKYTFELLLKVTGWTFPVLICIIKYISFLISSDYIMYAENWFEDDWNSFASDREHEILLKHGNNGKLVNITFAVTSLVFLSGVLFYAYVPRLLDILFSVNNGTRSFELIILSEYFIDRDKYINVILLHTNICIIVSVCVIIATESLTLIGGYYLCGLLELVSYHVNRVVEETACSYLENMLIHDKIKATVKVHYNALELVGYANDNFAMHYMLLLGLGVISSSINLYRASQVLQHTGFSSEILVITVLLLIHFYYMLLLNYVGQQILNQCHNLFVTVFDTEWYMAPLPIQKMLLFVLIRSTKPTCFETGGLVVASLEMFTSIFKASVSYFMCLRSAS